MAVSQTRHSDPSAASLDILACVVLLLLPSSGLAATVSVAGTPVEVTAQDCRALVAHQPRPDVAYQPGVDVHGKAVAPADDPASAAQRSGLPGQNGPVAFTLQGNPLSYGQAGKNPALQGHLSGQTALPLGKIEVSPQTGQVKINGQPVGEQQTAVVAEACRRQRLR